MTDNPFEPLEQAISQWGEAFGNALRHAFPALFEPGDLEPDARLARCSLAFQQRQAWQSRVAYRRMRAARRRGGGMCLGC